jgi:CRP/FNR family transcriptional regulator, cyclic AMP receptor protein
MQATNPTDRTSAPRVIRTGGTSEPGVVAVRLLEVDRELARSVGGALSEARQVAVAGAVTVPVGRWNPGAAAERMRGGYGLLVLRGLLIRDLQGSEALGAELIGQGDLISVGDGDAEHVLGLHPRWEVLEPTRLLVLDQAFVQRVAPFPALGAALVERMHERIRGLAVTLALSHLPRVEDRLHRLLWHVADRRGRVSPEGVIVRLPITQEQLGRLVGARRPTVSLALRSLRERGLLTKGAGDEWLLAHESPAGDAAP